MKRPRTSAGQGQGSRAGKLTPSLASEAELGITRFSTFKKCFINPRNLFCTIPTQNGKHFSPSQTANGVGISVLRFSRNALPLITPETPCSTPTLLLYSKLSKAKAAPRQHKHPNAQRVSGRVERGVSDMPPVWGVLLLPPLLAGGIQ